MLTARYGGRKCFALSDNFDVLEMVRSGAPVEFEIDGHKFALRQMTPTERDRLNYVETRLRDKVLADYRADGLDKQPVSDELQALIDVYKASLDRTYQDAIEANDHEAAIAAARELEDIPLRWPRTLAHERANAAVKRTEGRWAIDNLLDGDREAFRRLTAPEPLSHDAVIEALSRWQQLATFDPNSNGREQSAPAS